MNQIYFRKLHKTIGIALVVFIFLQAGSGLFLSFEVKHSHAHTDAVTGLDKQEQKADLLVNERITNPEKDFDVIKTVEAVVPEHGDEANDKQGMLQLVHHGGGFLGSIYRIILASGFLFMAFSGIIIFYLTRKAMRR